MWQRFTVDVLAQHVADQMLEGEPTSKLAYRFFRKGRRDGRYAFDHASISGLIENAVQLAGSTLIEQLAASRAEALERIAVCRAAIDLAEQSREDGGALSQAAPSSGQAPVDVLAEEAHDTTSVSPPTSDEMLRRALRIRRALRARREADQAAAELRARAATRAAEIDASRRDAERARAEMTRLATRLDQLPEQYAQRFESIKHTGDLLWARYCNGFVQGETRRGSRSSEVDPPPARLTFQTPLLLRPSPPSAARPPTAPVGARSSMEGE